jgi:inorganic triphosphatase YgiF
MTHQRHERFAGCQDRPPREVELKLAIPDTSVGVLEAHLRTRAADWGGMQRRHEVTTYFDTAERLLDRGGVSLRVRAAGEGRIQTLKADRQDSVAADRAEWEWHIKQDKPDLHVARQVLEELGLPQNLDLEPVFRTEIDRTTRILGLDGGTVIETAYDKGLIAAGDMRQPIHERPIEDLCPALLDRLAAKVARRGRQIRHRSEAELHALRKSLKKLRYGIDFLRPVFDSAPLKSYLRDCKKLQQTLGDINDTVTATALAERLVKGTRLDLAPAVAAVAEQLDRRRGGAWSSLAKRWNAFSDQPRFWA